MATTNDANKNPLGDDNDVRLLLDEFMLIIDTREHVSSLYDRVLTYLHENSHVYNVCKIGAGAKYENEKMLEVKLMAKIATTKGG